MRGGEFKLARGEARKHNVVIEFKDEATARACYASPEYQEAVKHLANAGQSALAYPLATPDPSIGMAHLVFQIQDNRQRIVHPAPYTEARFRRPAWWPA